MHIHVIHVKLANLLDQQYSDVVNASVLIHVKHLDQHAHTRVAMHIQLMHQY